MTRVLIILLSAWLMVGAITALAQYQGDEKDTQIAMGTRPTLAPPVRATPTAPVVDESALAYTEAARTIVGAYNGDPTCATRKQARIALFALGQILKDKMPDIGIAMPAEDGPCAH
jgi:hypothetical protein